MIQFILPEYSNDFGAARNSKRSQVPQNFLCGQCDRAYTRMENLMRHQRLQCGKQPKYRCLICQRSFYRRYQLTNHNNVKHGSKDAELQKNERE